MRSMIFVLQTLEKSHFGKIYCFLAQKTHQFIYGTLEHVINEVRIYFKKRIGVQIACFREITQVPADSISIVIK